MYTNQKKIEIIMIYLTSHVTYIIRIIECGHLLDFTIHKPVKKIHREYLLKLSSSVQFSHTVMT